MKNDGMMKPDKAKGMSKGGLDKPMKYKEQYRKDAHPLSPVCKEGRPSVWDKRGK